MDKEYLMSLINIKYTWWNEESGLEMFYTDKIPEIEELNEKGINCAGLINIIRQKSGLKIPETEDMELIKGGTYHWFKYFEENKSLEEFKIYEEYEEGTLIMRKYRDIEDQGHMAIIINKDEIIHAYAEDKISGRVGISSLKKSHNYIEEGYYEYAIRPEKWLNIKDKI